MQNLTSTLEHLGFSGTESRVYISLLTGGAQTGYQIGRQLGLSRSSVYHSLDNLYKRGAVFLLPGENKQYSPKDPQEFLEELSRNFCRHAEEASRELQKLKQAESNPQYMNLEGKENLFHRIDSMLQSARREVYINTDFDLTPFRKTLKTLGKRGVRILLFSFYPHQTEDLPLEFYRYGNPQTPCKGNTRFMLAIDCRTALIASREEQRYLGTFAENKLLASIVSEHIHHDIYLLKLKEKYGRNLQEEGVTLGTLLEELNHLENLYPLKGETQ